jgi:hypothetical protein
MKGVAALNISLQQMMEFSSVATYLIRYSVVIEALNLIILIDLNNHILIIAAYYSYELYMEIMQVLVLFQWLRASIRPRGE